jgi:hypothetical protein
MQTLTIEQLLEYTMTNTPSFIGQTLHRIADLLRSNNIEFAVAGALSFGVRCQPRYTGDIDLLAHPEDHQAIELLVTQAGFVVLLNDEYMITVKDTKTGVDIDILFSPFDPEESARATATDVSLFGVSVPVVQSEYLLWMYLLSDQTKHTVDGIALIQSGNVNFDKLERYLNYDNDKDSLERLKQWIAQAEQEEQSNYSESIRRRRK